MCSNGAMKVLAWLTMFLAGILALGFLIVFVDLSATKIFNGDLFMYMDMALARLLVGGTSYIALRAFRSIRRQATIN